MKQDLTFVGLDVHADTVAVAAVQGRDAVRSLGIVTNTPEAIRRILGKLGPKKHLRVCYEAGPTGYVIYWQLLAMGIQCEVVAPSLVPIKASDRIKTDRRDAERLARAHRSGDLSAVWVPDAAHEALRDLVRAREAAKQDQTRAKHRLLKYLLRYGQRAAKDTRPWTAVWWQWVRAVTLPEDNQNIVLLDLIMEVDKQALRIARFDAAIDGAIEKAPPKTRATVEALQSLRGVAKLTAVTLVTEIGSFGRFTHASQVMSYTGLVPSEHSSGKKNRRGAITKSGNSHLRRVLVEAAWHYRHRPRLAKRQRDLQADLPPNVAAMAWRAQDRLHRRYWLLTAKAKPKGKIVTAVARELIGFAWAIGCEIEASPIRAGRAAA
ncbi:MAG: IS110 family transposase [Polyangiaceae bacterium]|nr:IS110 family transposase [Polyangiaceae bacterium]